MVEKYKQKECKKHGFTEYVLESSGYYKCKKCRVINVTNQRRRNKQKYIEYKGGACVHCGYNKCVTSLHFHHTDNNKEFSIGKNSCKSWEKVKIELDKCELVCANCHGEIHEELVNIEV